MVQRAAQTTTLYRCTHTHTHPSISYTSRRRALCDIMRFECVWHLIVYIVCARARLACDALYNREHICILVAFVCVCGVYYRHNLQRSRARVRAHASMKCNTSRDNRAWCAHSRAPHLARSRAFALCVCEQMGVFVSSNDNCFSSCGTPEQNWRKCAAVLL